jgi:hypothetical protein
VIAARSSTSAGTKTRCSGWPSESAIVSGSSSMPPRCRCGGREGHVAAGRAADLRQHVPRCGPARAGRYPSHAGLGWAGDEGCRPTSTRLPPTERPGHD